MAVHGIDAQADDLDPALVELRLDPRHVAELGGADGREVLGMREQHGPRIADPLVKADAALGRVGLEVGCGFAKLECHVCLAVFARGALARPALPASHIWDARPGQPIDRPEKISYSRREQALSAEFAAVLP